MTIVTLELETPRGDEWNLKVNMTRDSQDFTNVVVEAFLYFLKCRTLVLAGVTPGVVILSAGLGAASAAITLTGDQTQGLAAGHYAMRVRISIPTDSWGPFTPLQADFKIIS